MSWSLRAADLLDSILDWIDLILSNAILNSSLDEGVPDAKAATRRIDGVRKYSFIIDVE